MADGRLNIEVEFRAALAAVGWNTYEALMRGVFGEPILLNPRREVRRIDLECGAAYLKRIKPEQIGVLLKPLLRCALPRNAVMRELKLLQHMSAAGLSVVRPIAWGWRMNGLLPGEGFLMTEAAVGELLEDRWSKLTADDRAKACRDFGCTLGRCHAAGFFQAVRFKDVIISACGKQTLIDREAAAPWPKRFTVGKCGVGLTRSLSKIYRAHRDIEEKSVSAIWDGYFEAMPVDTVDRTRLRGVVSKRVLNRMKHRRYARR